ncbi:hypothetical protein AJ88_37820 [Mesorhizobium amorphae CCBAU 01583]|nr:hypothetical protein AJ88_37820 [Mesorhizobium amorphae CCBAU 01583]
MSIDPLANRSRTNAFGFGNGLGGLSALDLLYNSFSTVPHETGILMNAHPILRESLNLDNLSLLGSDRMDNLLKVTTR